jgi:hypothetical protein
MHSGITDMHRILDDPTRWVNGFARETIFGNSCGEANRGFGKAGPPSPTLCPNPRITDSVVITSDVNSWLTLVMMEVEREQLRMAANGLYSMFTKGTGTWTISSQRMTPVQSVFFVLILSSSI